MSKVAPKSLRRHVWDLLGAPLRLALMDQKHLPRFGWTTLAEERIRAALPHCRGRLLDIGAGENQLVRRYGDGVGVDVFDFGGGALIVADSADLPFADASFDTVCLLACLNHIPYRRDVLGEARRLIRPDGRLVVTMISPLLGAIGHKIWWYGEDRRRGGMREGETPGLSTRQVVGLCRRAGFALEMHRRFVYLMNHLYVFRPLPPGPPGPDAAHGTPP